jgi:hypothetical protein
MKKSLLSIVIFLLSWQTNAQEIIKLFLAENYNDSHLITLKVGYGKNKTIPKEYEKQILIALSYFPELKNITIEFRLKKTDTPLSARPKLFGLFQAAKKRKYIVTISEATKAKLEPILFKNLNFNAQIGVLGHELSHISDYITKGFGKMSNLLLIELFSKKQVDQFEARTDLICINHGLGHQLLEWSKWVRINLKVENWRGASNINCMSSRERYLNPETIGNILTSHPIYNQ